MSMDRKSTVKAGFAVVAAALFAAVVGAPRQANAELVRPVFNFGTPISLECANAGSHQDVAKTPIIKNTSGAAVAAGRTLFWKSNDGDYGSLKLQSDLAPGATVSAIGKPGNAYSCTSHFLTSPDLTIKKAAFSTSTSASIEVQNLDAWVAAGPSVVRIEVVSCSGPVLASIDTAPLAMAKGEVKAMTVPFGATSGKKYLRVRADATGKVFERDEKNNLWDDMNTCIH
jgi:hypothetical protein